MKGGTGMTDIRNLGLAVAGLLLAAAPARAGSTERVSISSSGEQADGLSTSPTISADGRFVAFQSDATNLVPGDSQERKRPCRKQTFHRLTSRFDPISISE